MRSDYDKTGVEFDLATRSTASMADRLDLSRWPGEERRSPSRSMPHYLALSVLARDIRAVVDQRFAHRRDLDVLDIGCGVKPYLPLVAHRASSYRGLDAVPGPHTDDVGGAESLPYEADSFDLVLCTQVLEHLEDPSAAVTEINRVLTPGGIALASTHGVHVYHPDPPGSGRDYWRWTHSGLHKLFSDGASWEDVTVKPSGEVLACLAGLASWYVSPLRTRGPLARRFVPPLVAVINWVAERVDRRYPSSLRVPAPGSLAANYLVTATKAVPGRP